MSMASASCIGEPISFLRLERYLQGDGTRGERMAVGAHLRECSACRACYRELENDPFELAPWSSFAPDAAAPMASSGARVSTPVAALAESALPGLERSRWRARVFAGVVGLAAAAAAALVVVRAPTERVSLPGSRLQIKGGELAIELIREHAGDQAVDASRFSPGDRFELRATCPPGAGPFWDVAVFEGDVASFPLRGGQIECGNGVALPGAFRLTTDTPHDICLLLSDRAIDRERTARGGKRALPPDTVCSAATPAAEP